MMARRELLFGAAGTAGALALGGCGLFDRRGSYRVRMTIEALVPEGVRSGSSVFEVIASKVFKLLPDERSGDSELKGQAVAVELPAGPLFALLKDDDAGQSLQYRVTKALSPGASFNSIDDYVATVRALSSGDHSAELPRTDWPMMVRFRDLNDPASVERVNPDAVGVKRILLETTKDGVTTGIEKRLPWLVKHHGSLIPRLSAPDPSNPPIGARITEMSFTTETPSAG